MSIRLRAAASATAAVSGRPGASAAVSSRPSSASLKQSITKGRRWAFSSGGVIQTKGGRRRKLVHRRGGGVKRRATEAAMPCDTRGR